MVTPYLFQKYGVTIVPTQVFLKQMLFVIYVDKTQAYLIAIFGLDLLEHGGIF